MHVIEGNESSRMLITYENYFDDVRLVRQY